MFSFLSALGGWKSHFRFKPTGFLVASTSTTLSVTALLELTSPKAP